MATRKLEVVLVGDSRSLDRTLGRSQQRMDKFGKAASKQSNALSGSFKKAAKGAAGLAAGYASISGAKNAVKATEQLAKTTLTLNKSFGLTVKTASEWAAVAQARGADGKQMTMGFKALATQVNNARQGTEAQAKAFKQLGISQQELIKHGDDMQWVIERVSDGLAKMPTGTQKAALSARLFGRTWTTIAPLIRDGSGALKEQLGLADQYGATFGNKSVKSVQDFIKAQREAKLATLGLQVAFGTQVAPALTKMIQGVARLTREFREMAKAEGVEAAITQMLDRLASSMAARAPKVAEAFVRGWFNASIWAKLLVSGWLLAKFGGLGAFTRLGNRAGTSFGAGMATGVRNSRVGVNILGAVALGVALIGPDLVKYGNKLSGGFLFAGWRTGMSRIKPFTVNVFNGIKNAISNSARLWLKAVGDAVAGMLRRFATLFNVASKIPGIGGKFKGVRDAANAAADRVDGLGESVRKLPKGKTVNVRLKISVPGVGNGELPGFGGGLPAKIDEATQEFVSSNRGRFSALFEGRVGALGTAKGSLGKYEALGHKFGLSTTSGFRPGDDGWHGKNRARDLSNGVNTPEMLRYARHMARTYGSKLLELIHTPLGFGIKNGKQVPLSFWGSKINAAHHNHVHVAAQRGAMVPGSGSGDKVRALLEPGEGIINRKAVAALGGSRAINAINAAVPRFQKGGILTAAMAAKAAGFRGAILRTMLAISGRETGGTWNPRATNINAKTRDHSIGLWQINQLAHKGRFGSDAQLRNPYRNARAAWRLYKEAGLRPWAGRGSYAQYYDDADRAIAALRKGGGGKAPAKGRGKGGGLLGSLGLSTEQLFQNRKAITGRGNVADLGKGQSFTPIRPPRVITPQNLEGDVGGTDGPSGPSPAEQLAEAMKALGEQVAALRTEQAQSNQINSSKLAIGLREAERALADMISGQLGTMGAQRGRTPGDGRLARY